MNAVPGQQSTTATLDIPLDVTKYWWGNLQDTGKQHSEYFVEDQIQSIDYTLQLIQINLMEKWNQSHRPDHSTSFWLSMTITQFHS